MLHGLCLQRICDDVPAFTDASTKLIMSAVRQLLNCVVFAGMQPLVDNNRSLLLPSHIHFLLCSLLLQVMFAFCFFQQTIATYATA